MTTVNIDEVWKDTVERFRDAPFAAYYVGREGEALYLSKYAGAVRLNDGSMHITHPEFVGTFAKNRTAVEITADALGKHSDRLVFRDSNTFALISAQLDTVFQDTSVHVKDEETLNKLEALLQKGKEIALEKFRQTYQSKASGLPVPHKAPSLR